LQAIGAALLVAAEQKISIHTVQIIVYGNEKSVPGYVKVLL